MQEEKTQKEQTTSAEDGTGIHVHLFGRTDVGMVRDHNEDNFLIADLSTENRSIRPEVQRHDIGFRGSVFVVCDGMGGAAAGEVASQIGVDTIYEMMQRGKPPANPRELATALNEAICEAGKRIYSASKINRGQRGMGTTTTAAVLCGPRMIFGQVGDSRAHIIRNGGIFQTTKDQSLVQQLIDAKQLTVEEARNFDRSNIILQALGTTEEVHVDLTSVLLRRGDVLVMCSDGLSGLVTPEAILEVVLSTPDPVAACQKLTQMACDNGGDDNITVIIARFDGEGLNPPKAGENPGYEKFFIHEPTEVTAVAGYPKNPRATAEAESIPADPETPSIPPESSREQDSRLSITGTGTSRRLILGVVVTLIVVAVLVGVVLFLSSGSRGADPGGVHVLPANGGNVPVSGESGSPSAATPSSSDSEDSGAQVVPVDSASLPVNPSGKAPDLDSGGKSAATDGSDGTDQASQEDMDTVRLKTKNASVLREMNNSERAPRVKKAPVVESEKSPGAIEENPYQ